MNAVTPFLTHPAWHKYLHTTVRLECDHQIRGIHAGMFEAEITVYVDPAYGEWQIGEMSIVGADGGLEKLIPIDGHPRGGRTEQGYWADAIERAAARHSDKITAALDGEAHR